MLETFDIRKSFHAKQVLNGIDFSLGQGEIHGLVGKNGAGKSTFVNIVTGVIADYSGQVVFNGQNVDGESVLSRQKKGMFLVPQHSSIIPEFSVAENIYLGVWPRNKTGIDWPSMLGGARRELERYGLDVDPRTKSGKLNLVDRRKLNIVRALFSEAKMIILDEPTTSLTTEERDNLFSFIKELSRRGVSFIFISHYLDEVVKLCDHITVFKDGYGSALSTEERNEASVSQRMLGESVELYAGSSRKSPGMQTGFKCEKLHAPLVDGVDLDIKRGEVVGFVGFPGSGARETIRVLGGLTPMKSGRLFLTDTGEINLDGPASAIDKGIVYVPYDRHEEGLVQEMSILHNISLSIARKSIRLKGGRIDRAKERAAGDHYYNHLSIKAKNTGEKVRALSGGNQQKVLVAKALCCQPRLLMLDEPTIGIDIGSREEILALVGELANKGMSIIYHTSDYAEMLRISDRVVFFASGKAREQRANSGLTIEKVTEIRDALNERFSTGKQGGR